MRRLVLPAADSDGRPQPIPRLVTAPGLGQHYIWGWDEPLTLPQVADGGAYEPTSHYPGPGQVRITANVFADPESSEWSASGDDADEFRRLLDAQDVGTIRGDDPKMHRTDTIDVGVVVHGRVTVEDSDGRQNTLGPGDVYIQRGDMHAWHADPDDPALVVFVLVGAPRHDSGESSAS